MTERQFLLLAGKRLFMFNLKLYFPEYLDKRLSANEYPLAEERMTAHFSMCEYMKKRPFGERLIVLFSILDERETKYLCLGRSPKKGLREEITSVLEEAEAAMKEKEQNIIPFPSRL